MPNRLPCFCLLAAVALFLAAAPAAAQAHLVVKDSPHPVGETLDRLESIVTDKGLTVFDRIDHAAGAIKTGQEMRPIQLLIFGNPMLGTPLMQSNPAIGIDLPLKALAWESADGRVSLAYTKPDALLARYGIEAAKIRDTMTNALDAMTDAAIAAR